jgi:hypothetical protein
VRGLDLPPIAYALIGCLFVALSTVIGLHRGENLMREEAVLKGHAEWVADQSGKPAFKWKECK